VGAGVYGSREGSLRLGRLQLRHTSAHFGDPSPPAGSRNHRMQVKNAASRAGLPAVSGRMRSGWEGGAGVNDSSEEGWLGPDGRGSGTRWHRSGGFPGGWQGPLSLSRRFCLPVAPCDWTHRSPVAGARLAAEITPGGGKVLPVNPPGAARTRLLLKAAVNAGAPVPAGALTGGEPPEVAAFMAPRASWATAIRPGSGGSQPGSRRCCPTGSCGPPRRWARTRRLRGRSPAPRAAPPR
jgi:hypothetical protein